MTFLALKWSKKSRLDFLRPYHPEEKDCCDVERGCYTYYRLPGKPGNALNEEALNRNPVFRPGTVPLLTKRPPTVTGYKGSLSCAHYHPGGSGTKIVTLSGRKNAINRPFK
jgi:hypothetical protein